MSRGEGARIYYLPRLVSPASKKPLSKITVVKGAIPLHEAVAKVGEDIPASGKELTRLGSMMDRFRETSGRLFEEAIETHAWRHMDYFYRCDDPGGLEQKRMVVLLTTAIYLREAMDTLWERTRSAGDASSCALFETALNRTTAFLSPSYFQRSLMMLDESFNILEPFLSPSLRRCGMELLSLPDIVRSKADALIAACHRAMDGLEANAR